MPPFYVYFITVALLGIMFNPASAIKCYNCSSQEDAECIDVKLSDNSSLIECTQPNAFCRKTKQTLSSSGLTIITRACGWIKFEKYSDDYCMTANTNFIKQMDCQCFQDGCNEGSTLKAVGVLSLALSIFTVLKSLNY